MSTGLVGETFTINQEETMVKVIQVWTLAKAHPKIAIAIAVVIVAVYILA